ncbi:MAG: hypothetical protein AAF358_04600 [Pseudomonadota bacterium]
MSKENEILSASDVASAITACDQRRSDLAGRLANLRLSLHQHESVTNVLSLDSIGPEYGTSDEVKIGERILHHSVVDRLENLSDAEIRRGLESGLMGESDAKAALRFKRQTELAARITDHERELDGNDPDRMR